MIYHANFRNGLVFRTLSAWDAQARERFQSELHCDSRMLTATRDELSSATELIGELLDEIGESADSAELAAVAGDEIIGLCTLSPVSRAHRRTAHRCVLSVGVTRAYRRRGIARALMERILEMARGAGYLQAELEVMADNGAAIALYRSLGFVSVGTVPRALRYEDGSFGDRCTMVLALDE